MKKEIKFIEKISEQQSLPKEVLEQSYQTLITVLVNSLNPERLNHD